MSQAVEDMLEGLTCRICGGWMEDIEEVAGNPPGYPRVCEDCLEYENE